MNKSKIDEIVAKLLANSAEVRFGSVSVSLKKHNGRVVDITYMTSEQTKEQKNNLEIET